MKAGKLFGKISVIDLAVIILVLLLVVAVVVRLGFFSTPSEAIESTKEVVYEKVECEVTLSFQNVESIMLSDPLAVGDILTLSNKTFGTVTSVERQPYTMSETLSDGTTVTADQGNAYTYIVKVKTTLTQKNEFLRAAKDEPIAVGQILKFASRYFQGKAIVTNIH